MVRFTGYDSAMRGKLLCSAILAIGFVAAPAASASPEDPYGDDWVAIAISPQHPPGGYGAAGNPDQASQIAMDECTQRSAGTPCYVADVIEYGCVSAVINNKTGGWAGGRGPNQDAANMDAASKLPPYTTGDVTGGGACSIPVTPP